MKAVLGSLLLLCASAAWTVLDTQKLDTWLVDNEITQPSNEQIRQVRVDLSLQHKTFGSVKEKFRRLLEIKEKFRHASSFDLQL
jgi:hypothetical protein